jgi:hypothetical protein
MVKPVYISIILVFITFLGIALSSYGLGRSKKNKAGTGYITSIVGLSVSLFIFFSSLISLILILSPNLAVDAASSLNSKLTATQQVQMPVEAPQQSDFSKYMSYLNFSS